MIDRESELDAFKRVDLSVIAASYGFVVDRKKTTPHSAAMTNGNEKIIITRNRDHYVFCSVFDERKSGTAIDFIQKVAQPGATLGEVRIALRPFTNSSYVADVGRKLARYVPPKIKASELDLLGVARRFARFEPITGHHPYLCDQRGIPPDLLASDRVAGRIRTCPVRGNVVFPHYGSPDGTETPDRCLTGYEIKGKAINLFSKGGRKGLWVSAGHRGDDVLAIGESGLDALSYLAERGQRGGVRVASVSGQLNPSQPALIRSAIEHLGQGTVVAAFDNDAAGDKLTTKLEVIVRELDRPSIHFKDDRPQQQGYDWNQVRMDAAGLRSPSVRRGLSI